MPERSVTTWYYTDPSIAARRADGRIAFWRDVKIVAEAARIVGILTGKDLTAMLTQASSPSGSAA